MGVEIGVLAVRRSIHIKASPERVWREFETFDKMRAWFGTGHRLLAYEPRVGGEVLIEIDWRDGSTKRFGGTIIAYEPEREVSFEQDWIPTEGIEAPSIITVRLTPALDGTVVELIHHSIEREGGDYSEEHRQLEHGWSMRQLDTLANIVESWAPVKTE